MQSSSQQIQSQSDTGDNVVSSFQLQNNLHNIPFACSIQSQYSCSLKDNPIQFASPAHYSHSRHLSFLSTALGNHPQTKHHSQRTSSDMKQNSCRCNRLGLFLNQIKASNQEKSKVVYSIKKSKVKGTSTYKLQCKSIATSRSNRKSNQ